MFFIGANDIIFKETFILIHKTETVCSNCVKVTQFSLMFNPSSSVFKTCKMKEIFYQNVKNSTFVFRFYSQILHTKKKLSYFINYTSSIILVKILLKTTQEIFVLCCKIAKINVQFYIISVLESNFII